MWFLCDGNSRVKVKSFVVFVLNFLNALVCALNGENLILFSFGCYVLSVGLL